MNDAGVTYGDTPVFFGISARFESSHITSVVGPSGSGKSSLLAAIAGITKLSSGSISFVEGDVSVPPQENAVVWVPQGNNVIGPRSAVDNVMIGPLSCGVRPHQAEEIAYSALESVGLADRARQSMRSMSGGEIQRVGFARAIASGKPVILADEPSSSLDAENTSRLADLLRSLSLTSIVIVATHDPLLIEASDRIVRMR